MSRLMPQFPRGARKARPHREQRLLACPRISPEWELGALRALMKPQTGDAIRHRSGRQVKPRQLEAITGEVRRVIIDRLGIDFEPHLPDHGDYWLAMEFADSNLSEALAFAAIFTKRLPGTWLIVDRIFVRDGRFYRRRRGFELRLVPASNVHLPRGMRAALRGEI